MLKSRIFIISLFAIFILAIPCALWAKYCSSCGHECSDDANYCENCGHAFIGSSESMIWNASQTYGAYVREIAPHVNTEWGESHYPMGLYFYYEAEDDEYRGSYYWFAICTVIGDGPITSASYLKINGWTDETTVEIAASFQKDFSDSAIYEVSITGETRLIRYELSSEYIRDFIENGDCRYEDSGPGEIVWDDLEVATMVEEFCRDLRSGDIPINKETFQIEEDSLYTYDEIMEFIDVPKFYPVEAVRVWEEDGTTYADVWGITVRIDDDKVAVVRWIWG